MSGASGARRWCGAGAGGTDISGGVSSGVGLDEGVRGVVTPAAVGGTRGAPWARG